MSKKNLDKDMELETKIQEYLNYSSSLNTGSELKELIKEADNDALKDLMLKRLQFGTAGIRGKMGPGYGAMNDLVVLQTSQGIVEYLQNSAADINKRRGIVIGFDNRHHSERFAQLIAMPFLIKGYKVNVFSTMVPTPFIPYSVVRLECLLGIMVTASHCPKEYNGIKVYWTNGAPILSEHAEGIQRRILSNLEPWPGSTDLSLVWTSPLAYDPLAEVIQLYFNEMKSTASISVLHRNASNSMRIAFTAMHGVSHFFLKKVFQAVGFYDCVPVKEQMKPDPDFLTVDVPNPEEDKTFEYAIMTAEENDCQLIFAVDPDGDRFRMAEQTGPGKWHIFTGNEIAVLLASYLWNVDPEYEINPSKYFMVSSAVSSKILRSMAEKESFRFYETLSGFKWIANMAIDCMNKGMEFVFGFEEAIGFMCGSMVMDKDGLLTSIRALSMASEEYKKGKKLFDLLNDLYVKYGYHYNHNSYFICDNINAVKTMFHGLRNFGGVSDTYPEKLEDKEDVFDVLRVRDVTKGYDSFFGDTKSTLPTTPSMEMITFFFENIEVTIRTSGTEPKLKYYSEIIKTAPEEEWQSLRKLLLKVVKLVIKEWIRPEENGFEYPQVTD